MTEKAGEILEQIKERVSNPFVFSFLVSWLICNWKVVVCLTMFTQEMLLVNNYETYFDCIVFNTSNWNSIVMPFLMAIAYTFGTPLFREAVRLMNSWAFSVSNEHNLKFLGKGKISVDKWISLQEELNRKEKILEVKIAQSSELEVKVQTLNNDIGEMENKNQSLQIEHQKALDKLDACNKSQLMNSKALDESKSHVSDLQTRIMNAERQLSLVKTQKDKYENEVSTLKSVIQQLKIDSKELRDLRDQLRELQEDKVKEEQRLRIVYAKYGQYGRYIEVTNLVQGEIDSNNKIAVVNSSFTIDPFPHKVKEIIVEYQINGFTKELKALEGDDVIRENEELKVVGTSISQEKKHQASMQKMVSKLFSGNWILDLYKDHKYIGQESVQIDSQANYVRNNKKAFDIVMVSIDDSSLKMKKMNGDGSTHSTESLEIKSPSKIMGADDKGYKTEYTRKV